MAHHAVLWVVVGFFVGSLPFSYWLGHCLLNTDVREYGDGNPGAANAWRAGTWRLGVPAVALDFLKGAAPVFAAWHTGGISGWEIVPVALAPVLGHAFSPFLRFHGGKAVAATFGIWTALTLWEGPLVLGLSVGLISRFQLVDGWTVVLGMGCLLIYLVGRGTHASILAVWAGNLAILVWKHRAELGQSPKLRFRSSRD